jgi:hypothetical protein
LQVSGKRDTCSIVGNVGNQKQIAHMTHRRGGEGMGAGRVWAMWAVWAYPQKLAALDFMHGHTFYAHKIKKS